VPSPAKSEQKSIAEVLTELWQMLRDYAKQETVDPLKNLHRFILWGVGGAVLVSVGVVLLVLSLLRGLQTHNEQLTGNWNWVPYLAAIVFLAILITACYLAIKPKEPKR
jgi:hypothetical protein